MTKEEVQKFYNVSIDYNRLEALLRDGYEVVCFVTYDWARNQENPYMVTDVATARYQGGSDSLYDKLMVSCRGTSFIETYPNDPWWEERRSFKQECKNYELMYIVPNSR